MINKILDTEQEYNRCFSQELKELNYIRFWDNKAKKLFANNITIIKKDISNEDINYIINNELNFRRKNNFLFSIIEINENKFNIRKLLKKPSRIDKFTYRVIETKPYYMKEFNTSIVIKRVRDKSKIIDAYNMILLDNSDIMGKKLAAYRTKRKFEVYCNENNKLDLFVCYLNGVEIGYYEVLIHDSYCKIEDFCIIDQYRNKGYGSIMIKYIINWLYKSNIK